MSVAQEKLLENGIRLQSYRTGGHKTTCPQCSNQRRNKKDQCLSVTVNPDGSAVWKCHHCDWAGGTGSGNDSYYRKTSKSYKRPTLRAEDPTEKVYEFCQARGINRETVRKAGVKLAQTWMPGCESGQRASAIAFPYFRGGELINVKYRTHDKRFRQEKDAEKIFFGLDWIKDAEEVVITEGEWDALVCLQLGIPAISVPDGAPSTSVATNSSKFDYVGNCEEQLEGKRFVIAVDADGPGQVLFEELARRLGKENCRKANYPGDCKDLNDVLCRYGSKEVKDCIEYAEHLPIEGVFSVEDYANEVLTLYRGGRERGLSTGWKPFDNLLTVRPGDVWVVTGVPNNGKSEWLDALSINLAELHDWRFGVSSFENVPQEHIAKWAEKHVRKSFWDGYHQRMDEQELLKGMLWVNDHFHLIRREDDELPTIEWVLQRAKALVVRKGIKGLIIDPYNELQKGNGETTETEFISWMLGRVRRFAQNHDVTVFFVAHPKQLQPGRDGQPVIPGLYDISGGANWANKADVGITVHRNKGAGTVEVYVRKCRRKEIGQQGQQDFIFNRSIGCYDAIDHVSDN